MKGQQNMIVAIQKYLNALVNNPQEDLLNNAGSQQFIIIIIR